MTADERVLEGIDDVDWSSLEHAYGEASDVPDLLRALAEGDARAIDTLWGNVFHQGTRYAASPAVVPFLVQLLDRSPPTEISTFALTYLHHLALGYPTDLFPRPIDADAWEARLRAIDPKTLAARPPEQPYQAYEAWLRVADAYWSAKSYFAVEAEIDTLVRQVAHDEDAVAVQAIALVASFPRAKAATLPALLAALDRDDARRGAALVAIAHLGGTTPRTREALASVADDDAGALLVLHAAVAIALGPESVDDDAVRVLTAPLGARGARACPFAGTVSALVSAAMMRVPEVHRERVVGALAAQHEGADGLVCLQLSRDLLELVFPARAPLEASELTPIQRTALEAIATARGWQWGNYSSLMRAFGLPTKKADFATWLERR